MSGEGGDEFLLLSQSEHISVRVLLLLLVIHRYDSYTFLFSYCISL